MHYCIPKASLHSMRKNPIKAEIEDLRTSVVVVKIASPVRTLQSKAAQVAKEVRILQALETKKTKTSPAYPNTPTLFSILEFDTSGDKEVHWFITSTTIPSITLHSFERFWRKQHGRLPKAFIAHTFLRLLAAFEFLHAGQTTITHGDLHNQNIILDLTQEMRDIGRKAEEIVCMHGVSVTDDRLRETLRQANV